MDNSKVIIEKADTSRFQHIAVSCVMSVGGCKFKMSNWQRAINCCLEVLERDSSSTKALYHKIQVLQRWKEFVQPLADLRKPQEIVLRDKAIQAELHKVKKKL